MIPLPYIVGAVVGASFVGRSKSQSAVTKSKCFGPRSGVTYTLDQFDGLDVFIVHAPDGTRAVMVRDDDHMKIVRSSGNEKVVELIRRDFEGEPSDGK